MGYNYPGELVDLGGNRGWLDRPAAESIWRIDRAIGHFLQITEAGRTWDQQNRHWLTYLRNGWPIALNPDTPSEHQKGKAIDSNEAQRILAIMEDHGWRRTVYRWVNGKWTLVEDWHFEHFPHLDNRRNDPSPEEDDMYTQEDRDRDNKAAQEIHAIHDAIFVGGDSMKDGKRSISESLANIVASVDGTEKKVNPMYDATFKGGTSMPDGGVSIGQSLADIAKAVGVNRPAKPTKKENPS